MRCVRSNAHKKTALTIARAVAFLCPESSGQVLGTQASPAMRQRAPLRCSVLCLSELNARLRFSILHYFLEFFCQHRDDFEQVSDNAVIRNFEDVRFWVFVDRNNDFRVGHTC